MQDKQEAASTAIRRRDLAALAGAAVAATALVAVPTLGSTQDTDMPGVAGGADPFATDFVPIDPRRVEKVKYSENNMEVVKYWTAVPEETRRLLLPQQSGKVFLQEITLDGKVNYLTGTVASKKGRYRITLDYSKFMDDQINDAGGNPLGRGKIGIGLRVVANINTLKRNLDLGGLLPIGVQASANNISGSLEVLVIGIVSPEVSKLIMLPTVLDQTSVTKAIESIGAIRVLVDSQGTTTVPHLLAFSKSQLENVGKAVQALSPA